MALVFNFLYNNFNYKWYLSNMTMQDILLELSPYDVNCKINNGWFLIGVRFNDNWQVLEPVNPLIEFCENDGMQYYGAPLKDVSLDEVFQCIKETIEHNKDLERRLSLFQEKVKEMQELFKNEDYNVLKTLEFKLKKSKEKNKKEKEKQEKVKIPSENTDIEKLKDNKENVIEEEKLIDNEEVTMDDGVVFVDTIAELSNNKMNENNYLK